MTAAYAYGNQENERKLTPEQRDYMIERRRRLPVVRREELPGGRVLECVCERCGAYYIGRGVEPIGSERVMVEKYCSGAIPQEIETADGSHHTVICRCSCEVGRIYWPGLAAYDAQPGTTRDDSEIDVTRSILRRKWRALATHKYPDYTDAQITERMDGTEAWIRARGKDAKRIAAWILSGINAEPVTERADLDGPF